MRVYCDGCVKASYTTEQRLLTVKMLVSVTVPCLKICFFFQYKTLRFVIIQYNHINTFYVTYATTILNLTLLTTYSKKHIRKLTQ